MRFGLVGCGRIGALHAASLREIDGVKDVVVADVDADRARRLSERLDLSVAASVADVLDRGLDGVVVCSSTDSHAELVRSAIDHGIPAMCEKPLASGTEQTRDLVETIERAHVPVQVGFQRRFDPGYVAARERRASGALGWIHTVRATTLDPSPPAPAYVATSGGIFRDCGVHDFDIIRWVTGREVRAVHATGANRGDASFAAAGDVDTAALVLELDDDTLATVSLGRYNGAGYDVRLELLGSTGSVCVGLDDRVPLESTEPDTSFPAGPPSPGFAERFATAYRAELEAFTALVRTGGDAACTPRDSLEALWIAEAAQRSLDERRRVELAEVRR